MSSTSNDVANQQQESDSVNKVKQSPTTHTNVAGLLFTSAKLAALVAKTKNNKGQVNDSEDDQKSHLQSADPVDSVDPSEVVVTDDKTLNDQTPDSHVNVKRFGHST